jgi:hypothetical protein
MRCLHRDELKQRPSGLVWMKILNKPFKEAFHQPKIASAAEDCNSLLRFEFPLLVNLDVCSGSRAVDR